MHAAVMIIAGMMSGDEHALRHFSSGLTGLLERLFPPMNSQRPHVSVYGGPEGMTSLSRRPWFPKPLSNTKIRIARSPL